MKLTHITDTHEYYLDKFKGQEVRFLKNRITGEMEIMAEDVASILGFESVHDMLSNDDVLDLMNQEKEATGKYPFRKVESIF